MLEELYAQHLQSPRTKLSPQNLEKSHQQIKYIPESNDESPRKAASQLKKHSKSHSVQAIREMQKSMQRKGDSKP